MFFHSQALRFNTLCVEFRLSIKNFRYFMLMKPVNLDFLTFIRAVLARIVIYDGF